MDPLGSWCFNSNKMPHGFTTLTLPAQQWRHLEGALYQIRLSLFPGLPNFNTSGATMHRGAPYPEIANRLQDPELQHSTLLSIRVKQPPRSPVVTSLTFACWITFSLHTLGWVVTSQLLYDGDNVLNRYRADRVHAAASRAGVRFIIPMRDMLCLPSLPWAHHGNRVTHGQLLHYNPSDVSLLERGRSRIARERSHNVIGLNGYRLEISLRHLQRK
jgi:hypothetical protein